MYDLNDIINAVEAFFALHNDPSSSVPKDETQQVHVLREFLYINSQSKYSVLEPAFRRIDCMLLAKTQYYNTKTFLNEVKKLYEKIQIADNFQLNVQKMLITDNPEFLFSSLYKYFGAMPSAVFRLET